MTKSKRLAAFREAARAEDETSPADNKDLTPDEPGDDGALRRVLRHRRDAVEQQGVVHEQQVGPHAEGLVDRVEHRVDREVHVGHGLVGIADDEAG